MRLEYNCFVIVNLICPVQQIYPWINPTLRLFNNSRKLPTISPGEQITSCTHNTYIDFVTVRHFLWLVPGQTHYGTDWYEVGGCLSNLVWTSSTRTRQIAVKTFSTEAVASSSCKLFPWNRHLIELHAYEHAHA